MPKFEQRNYEEKKVFKTVPVGRGSAQNLSQFDNNLDNLLEDLQSSVSRPGSALGNNTTYKEIRNYDSGRSNSLNRVQHLKASNPVTEYSSDDSYNYASPDGKKHVKGYRKEMYSQKISGSQLEPERVRMQNNINQLDSLLDDLKQVKQGGNINNNGIDPGLLEPSSNSTSSTKRTVQRQLHYGDTPDRTHSLDRSDREGSVTRDIQYSKESEGMYGETRQIYNPTPSPTPSATSTLNRQKKVTNVHSYPMEVLETTTPDINPEILANLDPELLPSGNTKVTTTIKTYTYEIPGSGTVNPGGTLTKNLDTERYTYSPNVSATTPSKSFEYVKSENRNVKTEYPPQPKEARWEKSREEFFKESTTRDIDIEPYQRPAPPGGSEIVKETVTTKNYQPGYPYTEPPHSGKQTYVYNEATTTKNYPPSPEPVRKETYLYKETNKTTTNVERAPPPEPIRNERYIYKETNKTNIERHPPPEPIRNETYVYKETNKTNTNVNYPPPEPIRNETYVYKETNKTNTNVDYPPPEPVRNETYIYQETHNTATNKGPYSNGYPPQEPPQKLVHMYDSHTTDTYYPPPQKQPPSITEIYNKSETTTERYPQRPVEPVNVTYKYSSKETTKDTYKGYGPKDEVEPLLRPQPFPRDETEGPPKRVEELMAKIGNEPPDSPLNAGYSAHEVELQHQKKADTLKRQQEANGVQKKEPKGLPPTKNINGPPVYYPPGHEMFAKKEDAGAWRGQGEMAKASGKYEYGGDGGKKETSRSGAAIVPVCLPLCCGLPCTII